MPTKTAGHHQHRQHYRRDQHRHHLYCSHDYFIIMYFSYCCCLSLLFLPLHVVSAAALAASAVIQLTEYFKPIKCFSTDVFRSNFPLRAVSELSCGTVFISAQINAKLLRCMIDRLKDGLKYCTHTRTLVCSCSYILICVHMVIVSGYIQLQSFT